MNAVKPELQEEIQIIIFFNKCHVESRAGRRGKEAGRNLLSKRLRFWMPSWPMRALSPKREKPRMELSRAMDVE